MFILLSCILLKINKDDDRCVWITIDDMLIGCLVDHYKTNISHINLYSPATSSGNTLIILVAAIKVVKWNDC